MMHRSPSRGINQRTRLTEEDGRNIELATYLLRLEEANEKGDDLLTECFWVLARPHQEKDGHGHPPSPGVDILFASKLDPLPAILSSQVSSAL